MANEIKMMAGSGGSRLYVGAHTFKISDQTLNENIRSIYIRADQSAMITSMKIAGVAEIVAPVGSDLLAGDFFTFKDELTEIVTAGGSFIGYQDEVDKTEV
jgi:hypothetical protein